MAWRLPNERIGPVVYQHLKTTLGRVPSRRFTNVDFRAARRWRWDRSGAFGVESKMKSKDCEDSAHVPSQSVPNEVDSLQRNLAYSAVLASVSRHCKSYSDCTDITPGLPRSFGASNATVDNV